MPSFLLLLAALTLVGGCNSSSPTLTRVSGTLSGRATLPPSAGGGVAANAPFIVIDLQQNGAQIGSGLTDKGGNYAATVGFSTSVAVIVTASVSGTSVRVSGIIRPNQLGFAKNFDGGTDIACEAGVTAVLTGVISGEQLDTTRIGNLETTAARFVAATNFLSGASVSAAAARVRQLTNDGNNPG